MASSTVLLNSRSVSSCIGSASMSPRSSTVGPGSSPSSTAITDDSDRAGGDGERQPVERLEHHRLGARQLVAELGLLVDPPPQVDGVVQLRPRLVQHTVQHVGHGGDRTPSTGQRIDGTMASMTRGALGVEGVAELVGEVLAGGGPGGGDAHAGGEGDEVEVGAVEVEHRLGLLAAGGGADPVRAPC